MARKRRGSEAFDAAVGEALRELRNERGLSLRQVAEGAQLGITKSGLSAIEHGNQQLTTFQLFLLCRFFDVSPTQILNNASKIKSITKQRSKSTDVVVKFKKGGESIKIEDL